jgi:hypothetical protein
MPLTVIYPFADYAVGDVITDAAAIAEIADGEQGKFVVRTADAAPEPTTAD